MDDAARRGTIPDWVVLVGYFAGVLVLGALLAPLVVALGGWFVVTFEGSSLRENAIFADVYRSVERSPFTRYFDRAVLVAALVLLWPALRLLRRRGKVAMGLEKNPARLVHYGFGFCLAGGGLLALGYGLVEFGLFVPDIDSRGLAAAWVSVLVTAVVVAALEEFLFRGGMLALLLRSIGRWPALLVVSALFAVVHFLEAPKEFSIAVDEVQWSSGLVLLGKMLGHLTDVKVVVAELLLLFLVGVVLASVRLRSRSLWMPMGLHAGWVFGVQIFSVMTDPSRRLGRGEFLPWMGDDLKVGVLPLVMVGLTWWAALGFLRKKSTA